MDLHAEPSGDARDQRLYHHSAALLHAAFARLDTPRSAPLPDRFQEILALIHRAPQTDLSNPFLAARAGLPVERFIRAFRTHTGRTPAAYVAAARIRRAGEALALTDKSIDQIAIECGFPNRHYFTRVFARQMGCGPAEFRDRQHTRTGR
jgi:transcriptional regulator GlxA family with amidase domain